MHQHTKDLAEFYTQSATKRHHTRRRHRPEFDHIVLYINQLEQDYLTVIELGCGDGRLYAYLVEHCPTKQFRYTGVDVSQGLIDLAHKNYPTATWVCEEMNSYLESIPQQSCDLIIAIASIQHLPTRQSQSLIFHESYRVLNYDGSLIMTNWSLSQWFLGRYWKQIGTSILKSIITLGYHNWRSMMIPFTDDTVTHYRFYHIFGAQRLRTLLRLAGFVIVKACYVGADHKLSARWYTSRNHFHIARKQVRLG